MMARVVEDFAFLLWIFSPSWALTLHFRECTSESRFVEHASERARASKFTGRRSVNYREVDADYPGRLIGGCNEDSEIFTAIYRRPAVLSPRFLTRVARKARRNNGDADTTTLEIIALIRHARDSAGIS